MYFVIYFKAGYFFPLVHHWFAEAGEPVWFPNTCLPCLHRQHIGNFSSRTSQRSCWPWRIWAGELSIQPSWAFSLVFRSKINDQNSIFWVLFFFFFLNIIFYILSVLENPSNFFNGVEGWPDGPNQQDYHKEKSDQGVQIESDSTIH